MLMNIRDTLLNGGPLEDHFQCYTENRNAYVQLAVETRSNKNVAKAVKNTAWAHVLTVILHNRDRLAFASLQSHIELTELVKACEILDMPRMIKQLQKKLDKKRNNTLANKLRRLEEKVYPGLSLTRTKILIVKEWVRGLTGKDLMFQALMFPKEPWQTLADLCHLNPSTDLAVDWFLPYCFGEPAPEDSVIYKIKNGDAISVCKEYQLNYELARVVISNISDELARYYMETESLETLLWYYDEFTKRNGVREGYVAKLVQRLKGVTELKMTYGKLVDILVRTHGTEPTLYDTLIPFAEKRMKDYRTNLEAPVAVLGDASASMQVAINTSSIITSLLCSLADAELHLFKNVDVPCDSPPRTVSDAVAYAKKMRAECCTSPAASLYYYYKNKKAVKTFIIVTDEEENTGYDGTQSWYDVSAGDTMFAALYDKYCAEIGPAKVVFVSFSNPTSDGQMVAALKKKIGEKKVAEFISVYKFDTTNPDLNKLDYMLEKLAKPAGSGTESKSWFSSWFSGSSGL